MTPELRVIHTVVKVGGGLLSKAGDLDRVSQALASFGPGRRVLIVPGGGPFADAVREMCRRVQVGDDAAHWMAVLGMDQYGHALTARIPGATLVEREPEISGALAAGRLPVLAPYRWLKEVDPLPHSWEVTSDSIAAWLAGAVRARRIVLIKPAARSPTKLVDPYFLRTLPQGVEHLIVTSNDLAQLDVALDEGRGEGRRRRTGQG